MSQQKYISDEQVVKRANCAVKIALEKKRAMDVLFRSVIWLSLILPRPFLNRAP